MGDKDSTPDMVLSTGKEIRFDLSKMSYGQYLGLWDPDEADEKSFLTISRVCGMPWEEMRELPYPEYKLLMSKFFQRCKDPVNSPNA